MTEDDRCRLENENAKLRSLVRGLSICAMTVAGNACNKCPLYDANALYKRCRKNQRLAEVGMDDLI